MSDDRATKEPVEPRIRAAWQEWLAALATDAEAAIAAAHVYAELAPEARDAWLEALSEDAPSVKVPTVAVYAPLLSVEADPDRRARIEAAIGGDVAKVLNVRATRAFRGTAPRGSRVVALVAPLYLDFVHVLTCRYSPYEGFAWVRHDPLLHSGDAPCDGTCMDAIALEATPLKLVIEELAHAILAERRRGGELPPSLRIFANLFDAQLDAETFP